MGVIAIRTSLAAPKSVNDIMVGQEHCLSGAFT
jgi:hypothetical protein